MCLLVVGFGVHPVFDLVVAGNRDERHARPTAALDWWSDAPDILAGRDLQAGGTWLGVHRNGRFAAVTNFREVQQPRPAWPSRGELVAQFLRSAVSAEEYLEGLRDIAWRYAGFSLLLADTAQLWYVSNRYDRFARQLTPGIYGLSNDVLDTPWPKLVRSRTRLAAWIDRGSVAPAPLFTLLGDRDPAQSGPEEPTPELARLASAPFIVHDQYGTRCSTLVTRSAASLGQPVRLRVEEHRFAAGGRPAGETTVTTEPAACPEL